eukprot:TRINITY_DN11371_c0_g1_i3.p1 TRINITY_DN11371_c0_g1~~TRINITY_DN11371_c0_g1_i3.p1  ORF type:complete len:779 (+),score=149.00 TRINITY_DN11371_c0_g1_i3:130-2466(+)
MASRSTLWTLVQSTAVAILGAGAFVDSDLCLRYGTLGLLTGMVVPLLIPWQLLASVMRRASLASYAYCAQEARRNTFELHLSALRRLWRLEEEQSEHPYSQATSIRELIPTSDFRNTLFWLQLEQLMPLVIRDFVRSWYELNVGDDEAVPELAQDMLLDLTHNLMERAAALDRSAVTMELVEVAETHFRRVLRCQAVAANEAELAALFQEPTFDPVTVQACHHAANPDVNVRRGYFAALADHLLLMSAPQDLMVSPLARKVLTNTIATCLFNPTLVTLSDPDYIRQCLVLIIEPMVTGDALATKANDSHTGHDERDNAGQNDRHASMSSSSTSDTFYSDDNYDNFSTHDDNGDQNDHDQPAVNGRPTSAAAFPAEDAVRPKPNTRHMDAESIFSLNIAAGERPIYQFSLHLSRYHKLKNHAEYEIEVWQVVDEDSADSTPSVDPWHVLRRYRDFARLHEQLRRAYPQASRGLILPSRALKQAFVSRLDDDLLEDRSRQLDAYLQDIIAAGLGASPELRDFLTSTTGHFSEESRARQPWQVQRAAAAGLGTLTKALRKITAKPMSMVMRSLRGAQTGQEEAEDATNVIFVPRQLSPLDAGLPFETFLKHHTSVANEEPMLSLASAVESSTSLKVSHPLVGVFLQAFGTDLNSSSFWKSTLIVAGGAIDGFVDDCLDALLTDYSLATYLELLRDAFWVDGVFQEEPVVRSQAEQVATRDELAKLLDLLLPSVLPLIMGKRTYHEGVTRTIAAVDSEMLNTHLILNLLDTTVARLTTAPHY